MQERRIMQAVLTKYRAYLLEEEKSIATLEKYLRDVRMFRAYTKGRSVTKSLVMEYKQSLVDAGYAVRSINSMLASVNSLLKYLGWEDCRVKNFRIQRRIYNSQEKELSREEYLRLLEAAKERPRLHLMLETICGTGIRVSELSCFTVEAVRCGEVTVSCKNKTRTILIPRKLKKKLLSYAQRAGIQSGLIFCTKSGKAIHRSNIWQEMKGLCQKAGVRPGKVFPHNLRKLFARAFYRVGKDLAKLADILGHSSIETTRIYIMTTWCEHQKKLEGLGLVL